MINPQYTYDNAGNRIGVFLAIDDWEQLERIPEVVELAKSDEVIPEWQRLLAIKELENIANGTAGLIEWDDAKSGFKF